MANEVVLAKNNFGSNNEMTVKFEAAANAAAKVTVYPAPGPGIAAQATAPANTTYSGDHSSLADLAAYLTANKLQVEYMRIQTSNTANFSNTIELGEIKPNRKNESIQTLDLSEFRESTGNGFADTLTIPKEKLNGGFIIGGASYVKFNDLLQSSWVKVVFGISKWDSAPMIPIGR